MQKILSDQVGAISIWLEVSVDPEITKMTILLLARSCYMVDHIPSHLLEVR